MEITFVGIKYAETSPACVSTIGNAVKEPFPNLVDIFAARSNDLGCKNKEHLLDKLHDQVDTT